MLVLASICLFACKEKVEVGVDSVSFVQQGISLLVGEEYAPEVKVLPSYATDRSYTLISSDVTALSVEGGNIIAMKATLGVKLKVVSNNNSNLNDVISVNIYDRASQLEKPSQLSFDGNKITFIGKDNANAYMLKVNGTEINIGNNTEYSFVSLAEKVDDLYNNIITCSVKSVGDGKIFTDSEYTEEISFIKVSSVNNVKIENNILSFDGIEGVSSYIVDVLVNNNIIADKTRTISTPDLNLEYLVDSVNGAEYIIRITPSLANYGIDGVDVFGGVSTEVSFIVVGKVVNVSINNKVASWDFVKNAQSYTINLYKDDQFLTKYENITTNSLLLEYEDVGEYYFEILANSTKANTTTGKVYSDRVTYTILDVPVVEAQNNRVAWNRISGAEGYLVTIKNVGQGGTVLVNKQFVLTSDQSLIEYDVSSFGAGKYSIEVIACGNEQTVLSSKVSNIANWTKLSGVKVAVKNETLLWQNIGENTTHKYILTIDGKTINLSAQDYGDVYKYDEVSRTFSYDLKNYGFVADNENIESKTYGISVQAIGDGNVFDSDFGNGQNSTTITKLPNSSIIELKNGYFTITPVVGASRYSIEVSKVGDDTFETIVLGGASTRIKLDETKLSAGGGQYIAKVLVFGNGTNVFNADNDEGETTMSFSKLATPTLDISAGTTTLSIGSIANAEEYVLLESINGRNTTKNLGLETAYDLSDISTAGDYTYTVQARGNNADILNSDITDSAGAIRVKKLNKPTISFNKSTMTVLVDCVDSNFVADYSVNLTQNIEGVESSKILTITTANNSIDCNSEITQVGTYSVRATANPITDTVEGYKLVLGSSESNIKTVTKIDGKCDFTVSNGKLVITPQTTLDTSAGKTYSLNLTISGIALNDISYAGGQFVVNVYNPTTFASVNESLEGLFDVAEEHEISTEINCSHADIVKSNIEKCADKLKVLGKVGTINKKGQSVEFGLVDNATSYRAIVSLNGAERIVNLNPIEGQPQNVVKVADLVATTTQQAQVIYTVKFIALSDDAKTLPNRGTAEYQFKFLNTPTISVDRQDGGFAKILNIGGDQETSRYSISLTQGETVYETDNTSINLDNLTQFVAGNIAVTAIARSSDADIYFDSKTKTIGVLKLAVPELTAVNGLVQWARVNNAEQYNLTYTNSNNEDGVTIVLKQGVENFNIIGNVCVYNFETLTSGISQLSLQVDSVEGSYLNSTVGAKTQFNKLATPTIGVQNGQVYVELLAKDVEYLNRIEIKVDNVDKNIGIAVNGTSLTCSTEGVLITESATVCRIVVDPSLLIAYGENELKTENISVKLYAKNLQDYGLNSSIAQKDVKGLLSPVALDITTSTNKDESQYINEVLEKIAWNNPTANGAYVSKYEIVINYESVDYKFYSDISAGTIFMMPTYFDADENGVFDEGEVEFSAGIYKIKVKALTNNADNIVNSQYCDEIEVVVLSTPTELKTENGNVVWSIDNNVEYYLIKVYLLKDADGNIKQDLVWQTQTSKNDNWFDLSSISLDAGIYGVAVQAMHNNARILSSKESEVLQVIRLPQVESYFVHEGELWINMHAFFTKAEIRVSQGDKIYTLTIENSDLSVYDQYINENDFEWVNSDILSLNDQMLRSVKYRNVNGDTTLVDLLADTENSEGYTIQVKLYGNSTDKGCIISGQKAENPINIVAQSNNIKKLITPTLSVSNEKRGVMLLGLNNGIKMELSYYNYLDGETIKTLQGVHLYQVNVFVNTDVYIMYVADIIDQDKFEASGCMVVTDNDEIGLKHFNFNNREFNVLNKNSSSQIEFDFNASKYYYYATQYNEEVGNNEIVRKEINLSLGGSFVVNARFIGDDVKWVNSVYCSNEQITRYTSIGATITNGEVYWTNQASGAEHPVYLLEITNSNNAYERYNLILYHGNLHSLEGDAGLYQIFAPDRYYFDTIEYLEDGKYAGEKLIYNRLADKILEMRNATIARLQTELSLTTDDNRKQELEKQIKDLIDAIVVNGGEFSVSIRAHYTPNSANNTILAQTATPVSMSLIPKSTVGVIDGALNWRLSSLSISTGSGTQYIYDYLLEIVYGQTIFKKTLTYNPNNETGDYKYGTNNNGEPIAIFELTETITNENGEMFTFVAGNRYEFKLTALGLQDGQINAVATETTNSILPDVAITIDAGKVKWEQSGVVELNIVYKYDNADIVFEQTISASKEFNLPDFINSGATNLLAGYDYVIRARLKGNNSTISGFFSNEVTMQRLSTVDKTSINTQNGIMKWAESGYLDADKHLVTEGVTYIVKYSYISEYEDGDGKINYKVETGQSNILSDASFDFAGVSSGEIYVSVYAYHNYHFTSFASGKIISRVDETIDEGYIKLFKLGIPDNNKIEFDDKTNIISWGMVKDNQGQDIVNYQVRIKQGEKIEDYGCTGTQWQLPANAITGAGFEFAVRAIAGDVTGTLINGEYCEYVTMTMPNAVNEEYFVFDTELQQFKWKTIEGEQEGDKYYIGYYYNQFGATEIQSPEPILIDAEADADGYYYYKPYVIGCYSNIYVKVVRAGSLSSQTYCKDDNGNKYVLNFDLFGSGNGGLSEPYTIENETHLRNIKYFPSANYVIPKNNGNSISINLATDGQNVKPILDANQEFTGIINGNGATIVANDSTIEGVVWNNIYLVGLFPRANKATFTNIKLEGFAISDLTYTNTYVGLLVANAINTTFNDVYITGSTIQIVENTNDGSTNDKETVYIGAISGSATECVFVNCVVNLKQDDQNSSNIIIDVSGFESSVMIGAFSGYVSGSTFTNQNTDETVADYYAYIAQWARKGDNTPAVCCGALVGIVENGVTFNGYTSGKFATKDNLGTITDRTELVGYTKN